MVFMDKTGVTLRLISQKSISVPGGDFLKWLADFGAGRGIGMAE